MAAVEPTEELSSRFQTAVDNLKLPELNRYDVKYLLWVDDLIRTAMIARKAEKFQLLTQITDMLEVETIKNLEEYFKKNSRERAALRQKILTCHHAEVSKHGASLKGLNDRETELFKVYTTLYIKRINRLTYDTSTERSSAAKFLTELRDQFESQLLEFRTERLSHAGSPQEFIKNRIEQLSTLLEAIIPHEQNARFQTDLDKISSLSKEKLGQLKHQLDEEFLGLRVENLSHPKPPEHIINRMTEILTLLEAIKKREKGGGRRKRSRKQRKKRKFWSYKI